MVHHYLLDGYNILHAVPELMRLLESSGAEHARQRLADLIRIYCASREITVTIAYDATSMPDAFDDYIRGAQPLQVFVGSDKTADEYIINELDNAHSSSTTVVTGDRHIIEEAHRSGCKTMEPLEFHKLISSQKTRGKPGNRPKKYSPHALTDDEVEGWLSIFDEDKSDDQ